MKWFLIVAALFCTSLVFAQNQEFKYKAEGYSSKCLGFCLTEYASSGNYSLCKNAFSRAEYEHGWIKDAINEERKVQLHEDNWIKKMCEAYSKESEREKRNVCYRSSYQAIWCLIKK